MYADDIDRSRDRYFKPVKVNRSVQQILSTETGVLRVSLSCYSCEHCINTKFDSCTNAQKKTCRNVVMKKIDTSEDIVSEPFSVKDSVRNGSLVVTITFSELTKPQLRWGKMSKTIWDVYFQDLPK
ncbi:hypothetical protein DPMN_000166 [Dreissena polymorpha]|uniref:Uncharacterized protein n=1 Tax=Dreissena polymorpha TaxID=45954 RepID=A0A9D4MJ83_DREPO|nr:hypothetical protein DPMN_000166 [Dreissena polymorpha]